MKSYFICFLTVGLLVICPLSYAETDNVAVVGTWKLISIDWVDSNGEVTRADEWMGKNPIGVIIYDPIGYMSVQLMRNPKEKEAHERFYAYFGTYEVKGKEGLVSHHVQGGLWLSEVGVTLERKFKISGNRLMITTPHLRRLTFERVEKVK